MSHQKFESGRTLLETLAVLVVIAVLILAGIVGYNFAIKKYRETQTVKQVSELGVRYQLRPIQPGKNGLVDIKPVYPEAERVSAVEMKTADTETGRVSLQVQDTVSSFSIVVNQVLDDSCKAILTEGSYDSVLFKDGSEAYEDSKEYVAIGKDLLKNWDSVSNDAKPEDLRDKTKEEVIAHLCQPNGEGKVHNMSLVFGDNCPSMGGSYWYGGKCWNCAQDRAQDKYGNCCAKGQVDVCGFCPGKCPNGGVCNTETKMCVECISDAQCTGRADGKLKCDTSINKCVECLNVGGLCSGTGPGTGTVDKYCMKNHTCQECDTTQHLRWNKDLDICECATPLIAIGETCFDGCCVNGASCHNGVCVACWADYDDSEERKPGFCSLEKPLCQNGVCETCPAGQVWNTLLHKCAECNADTDCANNKVCNTALGICQCSADRPHWNGSQCMECLTDYEAGAGACPTTDKPVCNKTTADWHCEACPTGLIWNSTLHKCTGCHSDTD
ncbi:MAG: Tfp pilus assembly protein FimT/FimU, partial [Alphaproteobacteria bacterium]